MTKTRIVDMRKFDFLFLFRGSLTSTWKAFLVGVGGVDLSRNPSVNFIRKKGELYYFLLSRFFFAVVVCPVNRPTDRLSESMSKDDFFSSFLSFPLFLLEPAEKSRRESLQKLFSLSLSRPKSDWRIQRQRRKKTFFLLFFSFSTMDFLLFVAFQFALFMMCVLFTYFVFGRSALIPFYLQKITFSLFRGKEVILPLIPTDYPPFFRKITHKYILSILKWSGKIVIYW